MKNLRYMCVQPAIPYYTWQVEVMLHNFMKHGINPNNIDVICSLRPGTGIPPVWTKLAEHFNAVRFFFYLDDRVQSPYISSIRPNVLKKHFAAHPELTDEAIFYHDSDIILTKPPAWDKFLEDEIWYVSDTRFYLSAEYIKSKKNGIYERMCEIVGIDEKIPAEQELNSGGAQYIMKNVDAKYWEKVERDCDKLYQFFLDHLRAFPESPSYHPIQKWTSDMWAVLWNAWVFGHSVRVVPEMEFAWATQGIDKWNSCTIMHNAGVVVDVARKDRLFFKGEYQDILPYNLVQSDFNETFNSYRYVQEILETAKESCLV